MSKAIIVVDVQNDFCEDGALAVAGGNAVAEKIYKYLRNATYDKYYFSLDWHLPWPNDNGGHFSRTPDFKDTWPEHCVNYSDGAALHPYVAAAYREISPFDKEMIFKGTGHPHYSAFQGRTVGNTELEKSLRSVGIDEVDIVGIAGDYCVLQTARDARFFDFKVNILPEMVASVGGDEATERLVHEFA